MARKRMIDPGVWTSEDFSKLSLLARLIWIGLISNADDEGRGKANISYVKSQLFPYDDELSLKKIELSLKEIEKNMSIAFYEVENKRYYQLTQWQKFQTINRPTPSVIPNIDEKKSLNIKGQFTDDSLNIQLQDTDDSVAKKEIEYKYNNKYKEENIKEESENNSIPTQIKKHKYGIYKNVLLTEEEYQRLIAEEDGEHAIEYFSKYREMKGYKCKNDNLAIRNWAFKAVKERRQREQKEQQIQQTVSSQKVSAEEAAVWK